MGNTPDDQGAIEHARRLSATYRSRLEEQARDLLTHPEHRLNERDRAQMLGAQRNLLAELTHALMPIADISQADQRITRIIDDVGHSSIELTRPDFAEAVRIRHDAHRLLSVEPERLATLQQLFPHDPLERIDDLSDSRLVDAYRRDSVRRRDAFGDLRLLLEDMPAASLEGLLWRIATFGIRAGWLAPGSAGGKISALLAARDPQIAERAARLATLLLQAAEGNRWVGLLAHRCPDIWVAALALRTDVPVQTLWRLIALQEFPVLDALLHHAGASDSACAVCLSLLADVLRPSSLRAEVEVARPALDPLLAALRLPPAIGDAAAD